MNSLPVCVEIEPKMFPFALVTQKGSHRNEVKFHDQTVGYIMWVAFPVMNNRCFSSLIMTRSQVPLNILLHGYGDFFLLWDKLATDPH